MATQSNPKEPDTTINSELDEIVLKPATWQYDDYEKAKTKLNHLIAQEANKARETDEYGNPMVQLNMYEAKAVAGLLDELANSDYRRLYDTGDWFLDVPRKIAQRLLTVEKGSNNG